MSQVQVSYDDKHQLERIEAYGIPGETLHAVFDCKSGGTGFVGVTDQRVIFYDQGILLKKKSMDSVPFNRVTSVASDDEGIMFKKSELTTITAPGTFSFEFRGRDYAHWAYEFIMNQILNQAQPQLPDR